MTELPDWAANVAGFDPNGWWAAIVCTHRDDGPERREMSLISICFEHTNGNGLHYVACPFVHLERIDPGVVDKPKRQGDRPSLERTHTSTRGSMNFTCPDLTCGRSPRIPRAQWGEILENARRVDAPWIDLSLLG